MGSIRREKVDNSICHREYISCMCMLCTHQRSTEHLLRPRFLLWVLEAKLHIIWLSPCPVLERSCIHEPEIKNQQIKCKILSELLGAELRGYLGFGEWRASWKRWHLNCLEGWIGVYQGEETRKGHFWPGAARANSELCKNLLWFYWPPPPPSPPWLWRSATLNQSWASGPIWLFWEWQWCVFIQLGESSFRRTEVLQACCGWYGLLYGGICSSFNPQWHPHWPSPTVWGWGDVLQSLCS